MPPRWRAQINLEALRTCVETSTRISPGSPTLLTTGAYAAIFIFEDEDVIARVVTRKAIVGRDFERQKIEGQVAMMRFIQENSQIRVPHVYGYDPDPNCAVGSGWIVMSRLRGSPLAEAWGTLTFENRCNTIRSLAQAVSKLCSFSFPLIGSCHRHSGKPDYSIAPLNTVRSSMNGRALMDLNCEPWSTSLDFILALIEQEVRFLQANQYAAAAAYNRGRPKLFSRTSSIYREQFESLSELARLLISTHPNQESLSKFVATHADLNMDNIFVGEDGEVVGLIDFEFSGSYPLWYAVGFPDWISDEWLDDEDRMSEELEGMDLPRSCFDELESLRSIYKEEIGKGGEDLGQALSEGRELRLLLRAASSQWVELPKILRWMEQIREQWDESRGPFNVVLPGDSHLPMSEGEDVPGTVYVGY